MEINTNKIIEYIKKDFLIIIVCLVCLLVCMYALYNIKAVEQRCNQHWIETFKEVCPIYDPEKDMHSYNVSEIPLGLGVS